VKWCLLNEAADSKCEGHFALAQMGAQGAISQITGMVIVEARYHDSRQLLNAESYLQLPQFRFCTIYVTRIGAIRWAVHFHLLMFLAYSLQWYLNNMIVLNAFNFCKM
jgi:hypothetical protein